MVIIYADHREHNKITDILDKKCTLRRRQLRVADFILGKGVAAERKTDADFLQSLIDGRLFKQLKRMKDTYNKPLLIIEGNDFSHRAINENAVNGALSTIAMDMGIPIIHTNNSRESASLLVTIARREQEVKNSRISIRGRKPKLSKKKQQLFLLSGLPNVNTELAKRLLKHFKTPKAMFNATEDELMEVQGIGKEKAKKIKELVN
jgi:Fanconi anemia group M protein